MRKLSFLIWMAILCCLSVNLEAQCPNSYTIAVNGSNGYPTCSNSNNGTLKLNYTTYYSGATYSWSNGETSRNIYNLTSGYYSVTVTDPTTCVYIDTFYLSPSPTGITATLNFNKCQATLTPLSLGNVSYPVSYLWSDGSTDKSLQSPAAGVYTLQVTDADGCTGTMTKTITPYSASMVISATSTPATCNNNDGTIDLTVTGGLAPYTYYWYGAASGTSQSTEDPTAVPVGTANIQVRDANNCWSDYIEVNVGGPSVTLDPLMISCGQTNNGQINAITTNMTNPTFLWSNGETTPSISGLSYGFYSVQATDGGCVISTDSIQMYNNGNLTASIYDSTQTCATEYIEVSAWGGAVVYNSVSDYSYLWNTGETTTTIIPASGSNFYSVTVTDPLGCTAVDTATVNGGVIGNISGVVTDATCGNADGAIDLTVTNFSGGHSYSWSPTGETTEDLTGIYAGHHSVKVTNWNGCEIMKTFAVGEFVEMESTDASCGLNNGSAVVHDYGMTNPTFLWSNGATANSLNNLAAGTYYVTTTNGACAIVDSAVILDAGMVTVNTQLPSQCLPDFATAIPVDGAAPYTYSWNTGAVTQSILNPTPGANYTVSITDANGCANSTSLTIPNPPALSATYVVTDATCNNKNGAIDLTVVGGTAPFNFNWSIGSANVEDLHGLFPSQYAVEISDNAGCTHEISPIVVGGQTNVVVSVSKTAVNASNTGGALNITVSGVASPTFLWNNGATTEDITNLTPGSYQVSITDGVTGCVFTRPYIIHSFSTAGTNTAIRIMGRVYDVTSSATCSAHGALRLPYQMVRLMPGNHIRFTDVNGYYSFTVSTVGNYTVELLPANLGTTILCPTGGSYTIANAQQGNSYFNNFYVTNPPVQDLRIDLFSTSVATPGFPYYTRIKYCNDGNITRSGTVEYDYNSLLGFQTINGYGSTLTLHDIPNHRFNWAFSNLLPSQCRTLQIDFTVPNTTVLGTPLIGDATVIPFVGDATPANNNDGENVYVVGSWDPNDKQNFTYRTGDTYGGTIYQTDEEMEYLIRFQNTGTAPAHTVVIRDTLDAHLLPTTIRDISTKHNVDIAIEDGNILVATFNNIYLPDSSADFAASMGFIKFNINRQTGLAVGTQIENKSAIYFDFNEPIITNTVVSVIDAQTSVEDVKSNDFNVAVMPNPFNGQFRLQYTLEKDTEVNIALYNALGERVKVYDANTEKASGVHLHQLSADGLPSGMYFLQIATGEQHKTVRVIKQ